ncbi:MAG: diguanylate cyclase [Gammaproteobacteria bacterium]|nr:diguanylate cyclase [Gammaproteobacteria bacterium]
MSGEEFEFNFRDIVDETSDIVVVTDAPTDGDPGIVYVNHAFEKLTGYSLEEVRGHNPRFLQGDEREQEARSDLRKAISRREPVRTRIRNFSKSGRSYWLDINLVPLYGPDGEITHFAAIEREVTGEVRRENRLRKLAKTEELTELLNRRAFHKELRREVGRRKRYGSRLSLLMFDIDHFKDVNDNFGHAAGDSVLESIADLCRECFREQDTIGRIGGEEFAVILPETEHEGALQVAERFRQTVAQSAVILEEMSLRVTISIGVGTAEDGQDVDGLLQIADDAMYRAKESGRNRVVSASESREESQA